VSAVFRDTDSATLQVLEACYARMPPTDKLRRVRQLSLAVSQFALAGLRSRHPGVTQAELLARLAQIRLGPEAFATAYGSALQP
jgi:hypothetical protein